MIAALPKIYKKRNGAFRNEMSLGLQVLIGSSLLGISLSYLLSTRKPEKPPPPPTQSNNNKTNATAALEKQKKKRNLYSFGSGMNGNLGHGNEVDLFHPEKISLDYLLKKDEYIVKVLACHRSSGFLTNSGNLYLFGCGADGRQFAANLQETNDVTSPRLVQSLENNVKDFTLSENGGAIITMDAPNSVILYGKNWNYQNGHEATSDFLPHVVTLPFEVKEVAKGSKHLAIVDRETNSLHVLGLKENLGLGENDRKVNISHPQKVTSMENITCQQVKAGSNSTFVLDQNNRLFFFGKLTNGKTDDLILKPTVESALLGKGRISDVQISENHCAVLMKDGSVYMRGLNYDCQCGVANSNEVAQFTNLEFHEPVIKVACGGFHSAVISNKNQLWMWGRGRSGQITGGDKIDESIVKYQKEPFKITFFDTKKVVDVALGSEHSLVLVEEEE